MSSVTSLHAAQLLEPAAASEPDPIALPASKGERRRLLGAFYTPRSVADFMADWVVRRADECVLEPSFGDGSFLRAVTASCERRSLSGVRLLGVEIDGAARARVLHAGLLTDADAYHTDFLALRPFPVQAVIGNPPYIRLRHLDPTRRGSALAAHLGLGVAPDPAGSLWVPFVLHAMRFLTEGGRLAFVLPYEFTHVRYARPLWSKLRRCFGSLQILRTRERPFADILQDVVILLADQYGARTDTVRYQAFEHVGDVLSGNPAVDEHLAIGDLVNGDRVFTAALLGQDLRCLLRSRIADVTTPTRHLVKFNIGYVAGDKDFFHPSGAEIGRFRLPATSLRPALISTRMLRRSGIRTSSLPPSQLGQLFLPQRHCLSEGERSYIASGEARGVNARYKCRVRQPWFVVPGVRVPDVVLSVFSERPRLSINDAGCVASNSLLCGYSRGLTGEEIATRWYTSLTLLQCELEIHALGGGVMVLVPNEVGNVRLPTKAIVRIEHIARLDDALRADGVHNAYRLGDDEVLGGQLGFGQDEVELVRKGVEVLTFWRTSARSTPR